MKIRIRLGILVIFLLNSVTLSNIFGENNGSITGLKMSNYKKLGILVEESVEENNLELDMDRLRITTEMRLRRAGIIPLDKDSAEAYLKIKVAVEEQAYYVQLQFCRDVSFEIKNGQTYNVPAITWSKTYAGVSMYGLGPVMLIVDDLLILFIDLYKQNNEQ